MPLSTFDLIQRRHDWTSYGAVTFPNIRVTAATAGEVLRTGYYPCAGVVFSPVDAIVKLVPVKPAPWYIDGVGAGSTQPMPAERKVRSLRFAVKNPDKAYVDKVRLAVGQDQAPGNPKPVIENFPPQMLMDADFVKLYEQLVFTEYGHDLLLSDIMFLPEVKLYDRDGKFVRNDGPHTAVFSITHYVSETNQIGMVQRAIWDNGKYLATYGCC